LAEGGFQVGEMAKLMFPGGIEITGATHDEQIDLTRQFIEAEELSDRGIILFEAAIGHGNLFARADILIKKDNRLELIEVKAKSFAPSGNPPFRGARGGIEAAWLPYLQDIAFQRYLLQMQFLEPITCSIMLVDKEAVSTVSNLNQMFKLTQVDGRAAVTVAPGTNADSLGAPLLTRINVDDLIDEILTRPLAIPGQTGRF
jgi:hypothetical protein